MSAMHDHAVLRDRASRRDVSTRLAFFQSLRPFADCASISTRYNKMAKSHS